MGGAGAPVASGGASGAIAHRLANLWPGLSVECDLPRHRAVVDYPSASSHLDGHSLVGKPGDRPVCLGLYHRAGHRHLWPVGGAAALGQRSRPAGLARSPAGGHGAVVPAGNRSELGTAGLAVSGLYPESRQWVDFAPGATSGTGGDYCGDRPGEWLLGGDESGTGGATGVAGLG